MRYYFRSIRCQSSEKRIFLGREIAIHAYKRHLNIWVMWLGPRKGRKYSQRLKSINSVFFFLSKSQESKKFLLQSGFWFYNSRPSQCWKIVFYESSWRKLRVENDYGDTGHLWRVRGMNCRIKICELLKTAEEVQKHTVCSQNLLRVYWVSAFSFSWCSRSYEGDECENK